MSKTLSDIFSQFNHLKVLIVGDVMVDSYIRGKVDRISPEAPVPVLHVQKRENRLGGAANVALNIQSLGAEPILCTVIGDDTAGSDLLQQMKSLKLNTAGVLASADRQTTVKSRIMTGMHHMLRLDEEQDDVLNKDLQNRLYKKVCDLLPECHVLIFEDYDKGVLSEELIQAIMEQANTHQIPVVVDPKKRNFLAYKGATLFKPNLKELREGLNVHIAEVNIANLKQAGEQLLAAMQLRGCLLTLSEKGMYIQLHNEEHYMPALLRNIADVSGAGDTVVSVAALCVALQLPPKQILELSNLAGGLVCESVGVVPIHKDRLLEEALKLNTN
jgi:rfaE bifunctional protein kinase chain/domain